MSDDFAPPPAPDGTPAGKLRRADFRPAPTARRRRRLPRWLTFLVAAAGLAIVAGVAWQITLTVQASALTPAAPDDTGRLRSTQVVSGMCLRELGASPGTVVVVDCERSHSAEVVSAYTFTGTEFPGDDKASATVLSYCTAQLAPGGPLEAASDGREWVAWVPSEATWNGGDRTGLCIVTSDQPWTGRATD